MPFAFISLPERGATDALLAEVAQRLQSCGVRLAGTVQTNLERTKTHPCDMDLQVLPDGPVYRISQDLGSGARGCRLSSGALEEAAVEAARHLPGAMVLIVNKFGKLEAGGRGFVALITEAFDRDIPVLVGVNELSLPGFHAFAGGLAVELSATPLQIADWAQGYATAVPRPANVAEALCGHRLD